MKQSSAKLFVNLFLFCLNNFFFYPFSSFTDLFVIDVEIVIVDTQCKRYLE